MGGSITHASEDALAARCEVGHLDDCARVTFVPEVDEAPTRAVALLTDGVAAGQGLLEPGVVVGGPTRPVLHAFMAGCEKVLVHAGCLAALLDQLQLHIA